MIALITLNYNQNDYTLKCVESILMSKNNDFKLFLIDNGSELENYNVLKSSLPKDDRLILDRIDINRGYIGGMNYGLQYGAKMNPAYYLIMNNDTILDENAIDELLKTCKKYENKAIVTGKVYHYNERNRLEDIGSRFKNKKLLQFDHVGHNELDTGQYDNEAERDMLDDVFWMIPAKLYQEIGGYSTHFWFNAEQADFVLRAKKIGYKLIYTPNAKLWHKGSVSIGGRAKNPKLVYWHMQSSLILRYLHLSKLNFFRYFIIMLISILRTSIKAYIKNIKGDKSLLKYAKAKRAGFYYFLKWLFKKNKNVGFNPFN